MGGAAMKPILIKVISIVTFFVQTQGWAMPIKYKMVRPRAFFQESTDNLLLPLDLKTKTLYFSKKDFETCGVNLVRRAQTLTYSCTLPVPTKAKISKLQSLLSAKSTDVVFGGTSRDVRVAVSEDARSVTFTTAFDATGVDFEISKFNDDFLPVFSKVAQSVISDAMARKPVILEVLESSP
jgi:hypothetical protein